MRCVLKRMIVLFLSVVFVLSIIPSSAFAAECTDKPEAISFSFLDADSIANISTVCYYTDDYFRTSGMNPDSHLRTMSLALSMSAFESFREGEDYTNRCENIEALLLQAGFTNLFHNEAYDQRPTDDSIGIAIASKKIDVFGIEYTLIAVGVRGASYGAEWASNLRVGTSGQAEGFSSAKDQVLQAIQNYENAYAITDHAKIWIAGFSRAGAVSNLVGQALNEAPLDYATTRDDIYCYTFEAPQGAEKATAGEYPNIHNTVFTADIVPLLPLAEWGLTRLGYTQEGQPFPYTQDDLLLPATGSEEYNRDKDVMLDHLSRINPKVLYCLEDFQEVRFSLSSIRSESGVSQSEFVLEFSQWLNSTLPEQNRESYAAHYQDAFSDLIRVMLSVPTVYASEALKSLVKDPAFYAYIAAAVVVIQTRYFISEEDYENALRSNGRLIGETLVKHMQDAGIVLPDGDWQALIDSVYPIIRFLDTAIEDDVLHHSGYHLATFLSNMAPLLQAHCPEFLLAWLQTYDSYYTPERFIAHQIQHVEAKPETCTENGHREYWTCSVCGYTYEDEALQNAILIKDTTIPAAGHSWNAGVVTRTATESRTGIKTFICLKCGETRTEVIEKLPPAPQTIEPTPVLTEKPKETSIERSGSDQMPEETSAESKSGRNPALAILLIALAIIIAFLFIWVLWRGFRGKGSGN